MNAAETIAAAIEKLELLKSESTRAPWHHWTDELTGDVDIWHDQEVRTHVALVGQYGEPRIYRDAELIVTLHRTVEPILTILQRDIQIRARYSEDGVPLEAWESAVERAGDLDLARAILGDQR